MLNYSIIIYGRSPSYDWDIIRDKRSRCINKPTTFKSISDLALTGSLIKYRGRRNGKADANGKESTSPVCHSNHIPSKSLAPILTLTI